MNRNNIVVNIGMILCLGLFLVGCTPKNKSSDSVSLDFLVTPDQLRMHSGEQLKELKEAENKVIESTELMNEKYDDVSKMSEEDLKSQEELAKD